MTFPGPNQREPYPNRKIKRTPDLMTSFLPLIESKETTKQQNLTFTLRLLREEKERVKVEREPHSLQFLFLDPSGVFSRLWRDCPDGYVSSLHHPIF